MHPGSSKRILSRLVMLVLFLSAGRPQARGESVEEGLLVPTPPHFQLKLSLHEFSVLNSSALSAVSKYGGEVEFDVKMYKEEGEVFWRLTIDNPRLMDAWGHWLPE